MRDHDAILLGRPRKNLRIRCAREARLSDRHNVNISESASETIDDLLLEVFIRGEKQHGTKELERASTLADALSQIQGWRTLLPLLMDAVSFGLAIGHIGINL